MMWIHQKKLPSFPFENLNHGEIDISDLLESDCIKKYQPSMICSCWDQLLAFWSCSQSISAPAIAEFSESSLVWEWIFRIQSCSCWDQLLAFWSCSQAISAPIAGFSEFSLVWEWIFRIQSCLGMDLENLFSLFDCCLFRWEWIGKSHFYAL